MSTCTTFTMCFIYICKNKSGQMISEVLNLLPVPGILMKCLNPVCACFMCNIEPLLKNFTQFTQGIKVNAHFLTPRLGPA